MTPTLAYLEALARGAGEIVRAGYSSRPGYEQKFTVEFKGRIDLVTEFDKRSEAYLLKEIRSRFPSHRIETEETGLIRGDDMCVWYLDPIDGTTNYAHGLAHFAISIGYAENGKMKLGVVYDPVQDECFSAERGQGAWLNGEPIRVSSASILERSLVSTACYAYSARLLAQIAGVLGKAEDARAYLDLAGAVTKQYNACYWDESAGGYGTNNQSCNAISLYMGMVPDHRTGQVVASLVDNVIGRWQGHLTTGNICTKYLLEALTTAGRADVAYTIATQDTYPSWGYMLVNGATTLWERWEKATGSGMNSHNHPMLGSVGAWLYRAIAGIQADPAGPGFSRFDVRPNVVGGLKYAHATLKTLRGTIECNWKMVEGRFKLDLTVPVGSTARVFLPAPHGSTCSEGTNTLWQGEAAAREPEGVFETWRDEECVICRVGSGSYEFTVVP